MYGYLRREVEFHRTWNDTLIKLGVASGSLITFAADIWKADVDPW